MTYANFDVKAPEYSHSQMCKQVPDIIDNAFVIVEFDNGSRGMLDLCMFAEGSKNEQEISVVGDIGKVQWLNYFCHIVLGHFHS